MHTHAGYIYMYMPACTHPHTYTGGREGRRGREGGKERELGWTLRACGLYFLTLYKHGCFLSNAEAQIAVESGWKTLDPGFLSLKV